LVCDANRIPARSCEYGHEDGSWHSFRSEAYAGPDVLRPEPYLDFIVALFRVWKGGEVTGR